MDMNARLKRIAAMLVAVILVLQVAPAGTANESVERHTIYSEWWRPNPNPDPNPKTPTAEYTFSGVGDTVLLPFLLGLNGIHGIITDVVTDSAAVELDDSLYLKAVSYFDSAELTVTVNNKTHVFILHNPEKEPAIPAGTEVTGDSGSFIAAGAVPAGTKLVVGSFEPTEKLRAAVPAEDEKTTIVWMDIGLMSPDGEDIHTGAEVHVRTQIGLPAVPEVNGFTGQAVIRDTRLYHVIGEEEVEELPVKVETEDGSITALHFTAESFSGFALSYTVDFHYTLDGEPREISFSGGGAVSLTGLINDLGLYSAAGFGTAADFMAEVDNAAFSNPSLVWVGKTAAETTVGALKEANGLETVYSEELTEEKIQAINVMPVQAGDWALISLLPFTTEERLTVSMKNGDIYTVRVTDIQIVRDYITAEGDTYHIEVTLDEREVIEGKADLEVEEIGYETDLYADYLLATSEYMLLNSVDDISFARFFDIKILVNGIIFEPEYPAQVRITYQDAINVAEDEQVSIIHFAQSGPEVIQDVEISGDGKKLTYEQNGFSVTGTVVTNTNNIVSGEQYVIYTQKNGNYYAISHASEGRDKDIVYPVKLDAGSTNDNGTISVQKAGSNIVWTVTKVGSNYRFSFEEDGKIYYLRNYGGLMVGADSDINESAYRDINRYTWSYDNSRRLRALNNASRNDRYLSYSDNVIKERANSTNEFYFARVDEVSIYPSIHYVDTAGHELPVLNGRDWRTDTLSSPAFLIYDIDGYEYVKTTLTGVNGTEIRPLIQNRGPWQYTTSTSSSSITWTDLDKDIYVVYEKAQEPVYGGNPKVKESAATEDPVDPAILKTSVPNGDGTNTISLNITADTSPLEVEKLADVIVIFDVSTSMRKGMTSGTQYYNDNNTSAKNCNQSTRLWIAHNAVKDLANQLIGTNTKFKDSAGNKLIRMSLISFSDEAASVQGFTDDYDTYASAVEGLKTKQGTNWEAALRLANNTPVDSERATFVIFVTDGNPSYRATRGNLLSMEGYPDTVNDGNIDIYASNTYYMYRANTIFGGLDETDPRNYNTALDVARSIVSQNKNFYAIGVGPSSGVSRLQSLTTYAYGGDSSKGKDRTKNATNSDELTRAFNEIAASIIAQLGWSDIVMTDGITSLTNTVEKSHLTNVDGNFEYWKADAPAGWDDWSKNVREGYILGTSGKEITYPDDYSSWTQSEKTEYVNAYNQGKNLSESSFKSWNPASENCMTARYDTDTGSVQWDMGHKFVPEAGCTYKVTFKVWPSQEAYDILAKCRNNPSYYDTLNDAEKVQIIRTGSAPNYSYTLKTNDKDPQTTYKAARKTGDSVETTGEQKTLMFNDVMPLALSSHTITVKKEWQNSLGDGRTPKPVKLGVRAEGMDNPQTAEDESIFAIIEVNEDNLWSGSSNISTGLMKVENGIQTVYEHGHDFTITEDVDEDAGYHWELTAATYRPMVITDSSKGYNTPTTLILKKVSASESHDYVIDGGYYKIENGTALLTATNYRRSNLNLVKQVQDSDGHTMISDQLFEFTITVDDPGITESAENSRDIWFSVQTDPNNTSTVVKDLIVENAAPETADDGSRTGFFYAVDNTQFKVKMQPGWNLRIINLPSGTVYTITETNETGYTLKSASVDNNGSFSLQEGTSTGTGIINESNKQYTVTYTNTAEPQQVYILKTSQDGTTPLPNAVFSLYTESGYHADPKQAAQTGLISGDDGMIDLGRVSYGTYYLEETEAPTGYNRLTDPVKIIVSASGVTCTLAERPLPMSGNPAVPCLINTPVTASLTVAGQKVLMGRDMRPEDVFSFKLVPAEQVTGRYPGLPEGNELTTFNNQEGYFAFTLNYDYKEYLDAPKVGGVATFTYLITEIPPEGLKPGDLDPNTSIIYSAQKYWVQVKLEMVDGELQASISSVSEANPV